MRQFYRTTRRYSCSRNEDAAALRDDHPPQSTHQELYLRTRSRSTGSQSTVYSSFQDALRQELIEQCFPTTVSI